MPVAVDGADDGDRVAGRLIHRRRRPPCRTPAPPSEMTSSTTTSSDLPPYSGGSAAGTPSMDDLLRSVYAPMTPAPAQLRVGGEIWTEMEVERRGGVGMTLEAFLAKEGVGAEEFRVSVSPEMVVQEGRYLAVPPLQVPMQVVQGEVETASAAGRWRGKRKAAMMEPVAVDRVSQQRERRMIKNRESAARSRERKQAYTVELESSVTKLEDENARLMMEMEMERKARLKWLKQNIIPVTEMQRPPRRLRRTQSMTW